MKTRKKVAMARTKKLEVKKSSPADSMEQPNHFELKGTHIKIVYDSTSFAGEPQFTYKDAGGVKSFKGTEISQIDTQIGQQVSVNTNQIEGIPVPWATLTVLIPRFHLQDHKSTFTTLAIITTHRPAAGEPKLPLGALKTYRVEEIQGTAERVLF